MTYKASLDNTSKVITVLVSVLFATIIILQVSLFLRHHNWQSLATTCLLLAIYIFTYLYRPVNYEVKEQNVIVHRPASDITLLRNDIKNIEIIQSENLKGTIRTFGVGGMFGYYGQFANFKLGCMTWYATKHHEKTVLIEMNNGKKIILTPDEPEQFIQQLQMIA